MDMIRLAVCLDELCTFGSPDGTYKGMETMTPLAVDECPSPLGAPGKVKINAEVFPGHILSNWKRERVIQKIREKSAAPSVLMLSGSQNPGLTAGAIHYRPCGPKTNQPYECINSMRRITGRWPHEERVRDPSG